MSDPLICCIMPTRNRPEMAKRAVECFRSQSYTNKRLAVLDSGDANWYLGGPSEAHIICPEMAGATIGAIRNRVLSWESAAWDSPASVIAHFDDDDWSAPDRLSIQLAHIQKTGKLVTGFYSMLFYDAVNDAVHFYEHEDHRYALGTSLFYR